MVELAIRLRDPPCGDIWNDAPPTELIFANEHTMRARWRRLNRPWRLHLPNFGVTDLWRDAMAAVLHDEEIRRESYERFLLLLVVDAANRIMVSSDGSAKTFQESDVDRFLALLYQTQRVTNPSALAPPTPAADRLVEAFEQNREIFNHAFVVQPTDRA